MPFPNVLTRGKKLIASFRIWTQGADSIFYDDNRYAMIVIIRITIS